MHRLVLDIGNTRSKFGVFDADSTLIKSGVTVEFDVDLLLEIQSEYGIDNACLSTTRSIDKEDIRRIADKMHLLVVDETVKVPIKSLYKTPSTLGKDRLAAVVGAYTNYPGESCLCVSAGTCITTDFIDGLGVYQGGNIAPGIMMRLQAMHEYTDKLPLVEAIYNEDELGKSTTEALQNGAVRGAILELESFIELINQKFGPIRTLISGGDSNFFVENTKYQIFAHSNLVLEGLNEIMKFNDY